MNKPTIQKKRRKPKDMTGSEFYMFVRGEGP